MDVFQVLGIETLRERFLEHSRQAYRLLLPLDRPRILDIGCGRGQQTVELARLSGGRVTGIDIDAGALDALRRRIHRQGLDEQIEVVHVSLFDNQFDAASFDLLWEEGVLHMLDAARSFAACARLVRPGGHLVMHETVAWFDGARAKLEAAGFEVVDQHMLPADFWWTDYGAPLEARIQAFRAARGGQPDPPELVEHAAAVASIKRDPDATACGIYLLSKLG